MSRLLSLLLLALCSLPASALALQARIDDAGVLRAVDDAAQELWSFQAIAPKTSDKSALKQQAIHIHEGDVMLCISTNVYRLDGRSGVVKWRQHVPGVCEAFEQRGEQLSIRLSSHEPLPTSKPFTYTISSEGVDAPLTLAGYGAQLYAPLKLTNAIMLAHGDEDFMERLEGTARPGAWPEAHDMTAEPLSPQERTRALSIIAALEKARQQDRTNPWHTYYIARIYERLGDAQRTRHYRDLILKELPEQNHNELLLLSQPWTMAYPEVREQAFDMAMRALLKQGHEPMASLDLITKILWLKTGKNLDDPLEWEKTLEDDALYAQLSQHMTRLSAFAPLGEGITHAYNALYEEALRRGEQERASQWQQLRDDSFAYRDIASPYQSPWFSFNNLNLLLACGAAFWLLLLLKLARSCFDRVPRAEHPLKRYNLFNRLTRAELTGLLLLLALSGALIFNLIAGVQTVGRAASLPPQLMSSWAAPDTAHYLDTLDSELDGVVFMRAFAAQQSGEAERALALYASLPEHARAVHNTGYILHQQGKRAQAKAKWEQARALEPELLAARYNLGEPMDHYRVRTQQRYAKGLPMSAAPGLEDRRMLGEAMRAHDSSQELPSLESLFAEQGIPVPILPLYGHIVMLVLLLLGIFSRPATIEHEQQKSLLGWALTSIMPGASRHWGVLGGLVAALFIACLINFSFTLTLGGDHTNIMDALATPSFKRVYGASSPFRGGTQGAILWWAQHWWSFLALNAAFVVVMEKINPDPNGPFAKSSES